MQRKKLQVNGPKKCDEKTKLNAEKDHLERDIKERYSAMKLHLREMSDSDIRNKIQEVRKDLGRAGEEHAERSRLIEGLQTDIEMKREEFFKRQERYDPTSLRRMMQVILLSFCRPFFMFPTRIACDFHHVFHASNMPTRPQQRAYILSLIHI